MFRLSARRLFAGEQLFALCFGLLAVMNICRGPDPLDDLFLLVADWHCARQVPAILAVFTAKTKLNVERLPGLDRLYPLLPPAFAVVGMKRLRPADSQGSFQGDARILLPPFIDIIGHSVGAAGVNDLGHGVGELAEARLALAYRLFGQNAICIVQNRAEHAQRRALRVIEDTAP